MQGERKKQVQFIKAIENVELMQECSPEHLRMGRHLRKLKQIASQI